jgi:hypothetical protein
MAIRKGTLVETNRDIDCRSTGGPLIPKGSRAIVKIVRKTGELWVEFHDFGHRHVEPDCVSVRLQEMNHESPPNEL